jgi:2-polyprenyl-3-methyl-5-hydroxy-6-metoxy-1,4-benzoquinol methylase
MANTDESRAHQPLSSSDVLLANQLFYKVEAADYDAKNHVQSRAIQKYYTHLFEKHIFAATPDDVLQRWRVCDVGCGTGFLESLFADRFGSCYSVDATPSMIRAARAKLSEKRICWALADAHHLPFPEQSFDLVCSNAVLHHVHDYYAVLSAMISLLKPGGQLFLGYEPNAIPYRFFWPLLKVAARLVPEHRERDRIREESGQASYSALKDSDIHEIAEYHIFQGRGIHPIRLLDFVRDHSIFNGKLHYTSLYQFALLKDSGVPLPIDVVPNWFFEMPGRLSLSFSLTGTKAK